MSKHTRQHRDRDQQVHAFEILNQADILYPEGEEEDLTDINMSNEQFQRTRQAVNIDRRQLSNFITESLKDQTNGAKKRERILINGGAGTGKIFLFNLLRNQVNWCCGKLVVKVGALTGVSARLVGGSTLHRLLKLPVQKDGVIVNMLLLSENGSRVELYLFNTDVCSLVNIHHFNPLITVLTILSQPLRSLAGVRNLENLKELWAVECKLKDITPVEHCHNLEKLYLYSNSILEIPNLEKLKNLKVLWLSGNIITSIKNVDKAEQLEVLNLAHNKITRLGKYLFLCKSLHTLNLSGNPLYKPQDLCQLVKLSKLTTLQLGDPMYGECPVAQICNYRPFMVYHLPQVQSLDHYQVESDERDKVKDFYDTKATFYRVQYRHLLAAFYQAKREKMKEHYCMLNTFRGHLYTYAVKTKELSNLSAKMRATEQKELAMKVQHLNVKVSQWKEQMENWKRKHSDDIQRRRWQLSLELRTAGNLVMIEHSGNTDLIAASQCLLEKYVCLILYRKLHIVGVKVVQVMELHNKALEIASKAMSWNKRQTENALMLVTNPKGVYPSSAWPYHIFEEGFMEYKEFELGICNCLYAADKEWIEFTRDKCQTGKSALNRLSEAQVNERHLAIIVQFPADLLLMREESYRSEIPRCVYSSSTGEDSGSSGSGKKGAWRKFPCKEDPSAPGSKMCCTYLVSNPKEVLPIYIVEYQYLFQDPLDMFRENMGWKADIHSSPPSPKPDTCYPLLDKVAMTKFIGPEPWDALTKITLICAGIQRFDKMTQMPNVTMVDLSYNKLITLYGMDMFPNIVELDVSFNQIISMAETPELPNLKYFNISWNNFTRLLPNLSTLEKVSPNLISLDISYNPIEDIINPAHVLQFSCMFLKQLEILNDISIDEQLQESVNVPRYHKGRVKTSSIIPMVTLLWQAEILRERQRESKSEHKPNWVSVKGLPCTSMRPDELTDVKWADFSYNLIHSLEFLKDCELLEELSLADNMIQEIDCYLNKSTNLVKLDLSNNYLVCLKDLYKGQFNSLKFLDISANVLTELAGIDACPALEECYATNNKISNYGGIMFARKCAKLRILDVTGNGIDLNDEFRTQVVFYLPRIEFLNGYCVQECDVEGANQIYGGGLDRDYLMKSYPEDLMKNLTELTLSQCGMRKVSLSGDLLPVLQSLDLSFNNVTSLWGFRKLPSLKTLCLSYNHVQQFDPNPEDAAHEEPCSTVYFEKLETLYLNNNNLTSIKNLNLSAMSRIKSLFLHDNDITSLDGLQGTTTLQHLVLDRNNIQNITSQDCVMMANLRDIYLESNRIKHLYFVKYLKSLQRLFLANNKIDDCSQIRHLSSLEKLEELTLMGNPMIIKNKNYNLILQHLPLLSLLDGHPLEPTACPSD